MCVQKHIEFVPIEDYSAVIIMRTSNAFSLVLGTVLQVVLFTAPSSTTATPTYAPLVAGNTDFALNLFAQLAGTNDENIFFSPYSISACFGMVYDGARGETALQMAGTFGLSTNPAEVGPEFGALQAELSAQQGPDGIDLSVANGLWAQTNFPFLPAFLDNASTNYDAQVQQVDFIANASQITDQINDWVADKTDGMIPDLLPPGALSPLTRLALVDAIYFNGGWQSTFNTNATQVAPFFVSPNQFVYAPLMQQAEVVGYYEDNILQAIELPYTNSSIAMVVLLPRTNGPAAITPAELSAALDGLAPQPVDVILPKFKLDLTIDLVPILENMGMLDAFLPGAADFSGIDGGGDLSIGTASHEAVVEVNETGTVAAGATVIILPVALAPTLFLANHSFVFLIRDTNSANILFMGRVDDPTGGIASRVSTARPSIQTTGGIFGINNHQFGFAVVSTNATLVVEACTNFPNGAWFPLQTLKPINGSAYFSEPLPPNCPSRFYRVHSQ
jgi:serpin B